MNGTTMLSRHDCGLVDITASQWAKKRQSQDTRWLRRSRVKHPPLQAEGGTGALVYDRREFASESAICWHVLRAEDH
jgi:hypothetical protein